MKVNLKRMIENLKKATVSTVLQEAVVNSIQAEATNIDVHITYDNTSFPGMNHITQFVVTDNGEGFTEENIESFCEYGSYSKSSLGCKGIGRISFLKIFKKVEIKSFCKEEKKYVSISFDENFDEAKKNYKKEEQDKTIQKSKTEITFKDIKEKKKKNKNNFFLLKKVKEELYSHLLPLLYLKKKDGVEITINLTSSDKQEKESIKTNDLPKFEERQFKINNTINKKIDFKLHYSLSENINNQQDLQGFYCANNRTVCSFKDKKLLINPIKNYQVIFLLTSPFLDDKVEDERNDFEISPNQAEQNIFGDFSWNMINEDLSLEVADILNEKFPKLKKENQIAVKKIKYNYPHLVDYFYNINYLGGLIDEEQIIKQAEEKFLKEKQEFRKKPESGNVDLELEKVRKLAGHELIEYILMRDKIITKLQEQSKDEKKCEKNLHDLLMKQGHDTSKESKKYISPKENNIWLIDDKFMSYSYAASDRTISTALGNINDSNDNKNSRSRPDISIFFRNKGKNYNAVIIELKRLNATAEKKFDGLKELRDYVEKFQGHQDLKNIWYYLITKVDDDFKELLKKDDYKLLFSNEESIYFKYYANLNVHLYVISVESFIADARARNKTFLDIIRSEQEKEKP